MAKNASHEAFLRAVAERFGEFRSKVEALTPVMVFGSPQEKLNLATGVYQSGLALMRVLSEQDRPPWVKPLLERLESFVAGPTDRNRAGTLITTIAEWYAAIHNHTWSFDFSEDEPLDVDSLYDSYRGHMPELFDKLVEALEKIINSGAVDSIKIMRALKTLLATLKRSRTGSYSAQLNALRFAYVFVKSYAWEQLKAMNVILGPMLTAFETAMEETGTEWKKVSDSIQSAIKKKMELELPLLICPPLTFPDQPRQAIGCDGVESTQAVD